MVNPAREKEALLKKFFQSLEDRPLAPHELIYVRELHSRATDDPIAELAGHIEWNEGNGVYPFTGQRGTGKSTELRRLKRDLENAGCVVFLADMASYMNLTTPVELGDFLISVMGALSECYTERYREDPAKRSFWERVTAFMLSEVQLKEFAVSNDAASLKFALKNDPDFKQRLQQHLQGHVTKVVEQARSFAQEVVGLVRSKENDANKKVVLIVDSVEQIRGVGSNVDAVYKSVENLFSGHASNLEFPALHVVYTVPPYLMALAGGVGAHLGGGNVYSLPSVHIFQAASRETDPAGLDLMQTIVERRFGDWRRVIDTPHLRRLAASSGGDIRDYFRMLKASLARARLEGVALPVGDDVVAHAESLVRNELLPIADDDMLWLKRISATHKPALPSLERLPTLARFFESKRVLNYRNGEDWYDVHPLIRDLVDQHVSPPATGNG